LGETAGMFIATLLASPVDLIILVNRGATEQKEREQKTAFFVERACNTVPLSICRVRPPSSIAETAQSSTTASQMHVCTA